MRIQLNGALFGLIILFVLLATEAIITAMLVGKLPTDLYLLPYRDFGLYKILWASNPWETLKLLSLDKAILVIEHRSAYSGSQIWGVFYYTLSLLLHCAVALLAGVGWVSGRFTKAGKPLGLFVLGSFLLIFSTSYVYLASCCSSGPGWVVDVWLLSHAFDPFASHNWQEIYQSVEKLFIFVQTLLSFGGVILVYRGWTLARHQDQ